MAAFASGILLLLALFQEAAAQDTSANQKTAISEEDPRITELMGIASNLQRPPRTKEKLQKEIEQYDKILLINSNHQVASTLKSQAQTRLEQIEAAERADEQRKKMDEELLVEYHRRLTGWDFAGAAAVLSTLKSRIPSDTRVVSAEREYARVKRIHDLRVYSVWGFVTAMVGGAGVWFFASRRQRQFVLVVISGRNLGERLELREGRTRLGSVRGGDSEQNDFVIDDPVGRVSRYQCFFELRGRQLFVVDDDSTHGTTVDGIRINPGELVPLKKRARINLAGCCVIEVRLERKS